jgi:DNA-binding HxlR family transcriptional regulator
MATLKRMGLEVLEDIHVEGPGTRKELWERTQVCSWEMFKRLLGILTNDGVVQRELATPGKTDPAVDLWSLTEDGKSLMQSLC